jgi:chromosome segregation ATPase
LFSRTFEVIWDFKVRNLLKLSFPHSLSLSLPQTPCEVLHKEIQSLEVVVEIRNQEVKDLRRELMEFKELSELLSDVKDQNQALLAKVEDLEAQLEKSRSDKSKLLGKYQSMEESMSHVVTENDRLHLYNEELNWKIDTLKSAGKEEEEEEISRKYNQNQA